MNSERRSLYPDDMIKIWAEYLFRSESSPVVKSGDIKVRLRVNADKSKADCIQQKWTINHN